MSEPSSLSRFTIVLWRPKSPGNVGSVARAMKNMGFSRLRIADPMRYDDPSHFDVESSRMAWSAGDVVAAREETESIESAVADAVLVAGTTSAPPDGHAVLTPRDLAPRLLEAAETGPVALLFGQEDIGLTREAMARCQILGSIPSSTAYSSLNLAQAALLFMYEIRMAATVTAGRADASGPAAGTDLPSQEDLEGFYRRLHSLLDSAGFFEGTAKEHMVRELRRVFNRALLTRREIGIFEGVVHALSRDRLRRRGEP
ncbi:MAG TPA: RNA methyltransferase [Verrucomicrobiae bacterium]|nr:RNA methyltransferase [Verrucomicrobiae bacterium]